jgi:hypothetical protein
VLTIDSATRDPLAVLLLSTDILAQTPNLEAPDRLEHWLLNASRSLDSILKDAAAADRKALSNQASAPLKHLELRNLGLREYGGRLSSGMLKEQREAMHLAAVQLTSAMSGKATGR